MQRIKSREYKLILSANRFADRNVGTDAFQDLVASMLDQQGADVKTQSKEEIRRTWYIDTPGFQFRRSGYVLRIRHQGTDRKEYKITLKRRSPDRYLAANADVSSARRKKDSPKFEEDILPVFRSMFSKSNARISDREPEFETVSDAAQLFPGLKNLGIGKKTRLQKVNGFEAHEIFRKLAKARFGNDTEIKFGLSFWYQSRHRTKRQWPLIAECAFDYDADPEGVDQDCIGDDFPLATIRGSKALFSSLQNQHGWFDPAGTTKTRYAYEGQVD